MIKNAVLRRQCPEVFVVRKTLTQLAEEASLTEDKRLMVEGREVAVIYMRWVINIHQYLSILSNVITFTYKWSKGN